MRLAHRAASQRPSNQNLQLQRTSKPLCCSPLQPQQEWCLPLKRVLLQHLPLQTQTLCQPPARQLWLTSSRQLLRWLLRPQPAWQLQTLSAQEKALRQRVLQLLLPSPGCHLSSRQHQR